MEKLKIDLDFGLDLNARSLSTQKPLSQTIHDLFQYDRSVIQAMKSADESDKRYPSLVKRAHKRFVEDGWNEESSIHVFAESKKPLKNPAQSLNGRPLDKVSHAVVTVNMICVDPCKLRLGAHYFEAYHYPKVNAMKEFWKRFLDVSHLAALTVEDVKSRMANYKHANRHAPGGDSRGVIGDPRGTQAWSPEHERLFDGSAILDQDDADESESSAKFIQLSTVERDQFAEFFDAKFGMHNFRDIEVVSFATMCGDDDLFGLYEPDAQIRQIDIGVYEHTSKAGICRLYAG